MWHHKPVLTLYYWFFNIYRSISKECCEGLKNKVLKVFFLNFAVYCLVVRGFRHGRFYILINCFLSYIVHDNHLVNGVT